MAKRKTVLKILRAVDICFDVTLGFIFGLIAGPFIYARRMWEARDDD